MSKNAGWLAKVEVWGELILFIKCENGGDVLQIAEEKPMSKRDNKLGKHSKISGKSSRLKYCWWSIPKWWSGIMTL